jgi:hypothetical protein
MGIFDSPRRFIPNPETLAAPTTRGEIRSIVATKCRVHENEDEDCGFPIKLIATLTTSRRKSSGGGRWYKGNY